MSYTFFDRGMKNLLLSGNKNAKKYIVINKASDIELDDYYNACLDRKRPYIRIKKSKIFSTLDIDCITLPYQWTEYIRNKTDNFDGNFNLALEKMGITKNGLCVPGLGGYSNIRIRTEYVELFAEFIYNLYEICIIQLLHDIKLKIKKKKKLLDAYSLVDDYSRRLENEIDELNNILK